MNVEDLTGRDLVVCMAGALDVAIDAYPELVIPDTDAASGEFVFRTRVVQVQEDPRVTDGLATVDIELTDGEGVGRVFRLTITAAELRTP